MTKKHFIELADVVRKLKPSAADTTDNDPNYDIGYTDGENDQFNSMIEALSDFCKSQNPNFNRERWINYIDGKCGPNGGKV